MPIERVVFLPGASGDATFWAPVAARLPRALDPVLLAWPGLGHVPPRADVRGFADLVRLTLDAIDRDVALVAQSMGGVDVERFGAADWRADYSREYPGAAPWIYDRAVDLTERIKTITAPTLLLWGDADPISPVAVGKHLASLLPYARLVVIRGGDHAFARDRADEVAPHVARHLGVGA